MHTDVTNVEHEMYDYTSTGATGIVTEGLKQIQKPYQENVQ
jgi:hypothetical protein